MSPKVTVLMTVYNGERYLRECMDSVLNQTFKDFEFLIIDDYSTDDSKALINSYKDDRIRLIENKENLGQVKSLNIGIDYARGEYIARIDQDDMMMRNRLKRQLDFLDRRKEVSVVGTWGEVIDENGTVFEKYCCPTRNEEIVGSVLHGGNFLLHMSAMFKKDAVMDIGKYDESLSFAEDYDLWTRLLLKRHRFANIPGYLVKFRYHKESSSRRFSEIQLRNMRASASNFLKNIAGIYHGADLDRLCDILINVGLMRKEYWLDEIDPSYLKRTADLLEDVLGKLENYFGFKKKEVRLMRQAFCNRMLNFAYEAKGREKKKSLPLYLFCLRNRPYLFTRPKLYLYPLRSIL